MFTTLVTSVYGDYSVMSRRGFLDRRASSGDRTGDRMNGWGAVENGGRRTSSRLSLDIIMPSSTPVTPRPVTSDPWCLTCGVSVREMGATGDKPYAVPLRRHRDNEMCELFSRVLGVVASESYASDCVCHKCERQLRRLGRYSNIILARHEASQIREQLEKNLARHGQTVVESGQHTVNSDEEDDRASTRSDSDFRISQPRRASSDSDSAFSNNLNFAGSRSERQPFGSGGGGGVGYFRRGRSHETPLYGPRKLLSVGAFSSRSSSLSSIPSEASIDESAERELELQDSNRSSSSLQLHHTALSPVYDEGELRRQARRRKLSRESSTGSADADILSHTLIVPSVKAEVVSAESFTHSPPDNHISPEANPTPSCGEVGDTKHENVSQSKDKDSGVRDECPSKTISRQANLDVEFHTNRSELFVRLSDKRGDNTKGQQVETYTGSETDSKQRIIMESGEDKTQLVGTRSESLDQAGSGSGSGRREKFKNRSKFFSLSFKSSDKSKKSGKAEKSKKKDEAVAAPSAEDDGAPAAKSPEAESKTKDGEDASTPVHWSGRVNPFDTKESNGVDGGTDPSNTTSPTSPRSILTDNSEQHDYSEDDLFGKGIVDLDDEAAAGGKKEASPSRSESIQADEELMNQIEKANLGEVNEIPPSSSSSRQPSIDVVEMEEQVTLKSQFKGAFYNIGSTEDLLQEFANEEEARKLKLVTTPSVDLIELPPFTTPDSGAQEEGQAEKPAQEKSSRKGKLLKYESLDLDIDNSNPFFNDVFSEYNRRVAAKTDSNSEADGGASATSSTTSETGEHQKKNTRGKTVTIVTRPEVIPEGKDEVDEEPSSGETTPKAEDINKTFSFESRDPQNDANQDGDNDRDKDGDCSDEPKKTQTKETVDADKPVVYKTEITVNLSSNAEVGEPSESSPSPSYETAPSSPVPSSQPGSLPEQDDPEGQRSEKTKVEGELEQDSAPLIQEDKENSAEQGEDNEAMPFWKRKKKSDKKEKGSEKGKEEVESTADPVENGKAETGDHKEEVEKTGEVNRAGEVTDEIADQKQEEKEVEKESSEPAENGKIPEPEKKEEKEEPMTSVTAETQEVTFVKEAEGDGGQDTEEPVTSQPAAKSEKSPLISKDDGQEGVAVPGAADVNVGKEAKRGGILCCSIL